MAKDTNDMSFLNHLEELSLIEALQALLRQPTNIELFLNLSFAIFRRVLKSFRSVISN